MTSFLLPRFRVVNRSAHLISEWAYISDYLSINMRYLMSRISLLFITSIGWLNRLVDCAISTRISSVWDVLFRIKEADDKIRGKAVYWTYLRLFWNTLTTIDWPMTSTHPYVSTLWLWFVNVLGSFPRLLLPPRPTFHLRASCIRFPTSAVLFAAIRNLRRSPYLAVVVPNSEPDVSLNEMTFDVSNILRFEYSLIGKGIEMAKMLAFTNIPSYEYRDA